MNRDEWKALCRRLRTTRRTSKSEAISAAITHNGKPFVAVLIAGPTSCPYRLIGLNVRPAMILARSTRARITEELACYVAADRKIALARYGRKIDRNAWRAGIEFARHLRLHTAQQVAA